MEWRSKHTSKDGKVNGMYMPFPHDHDKWLADKKAWQQKTKKHKKSDSD